MLKQQQLEMQNMKTMEQESSVQQKEGICCLLSIIMIIDYLCTVVLTVDSSHKDYK